MNQRDDDNITIHNECMFNVHYHPGVGFFMTAVRLSTAMVVSRARPFYPFLKRAARGRKERVWSNSHLEFVQVVQECFGLEVSGQRNSFAIIAIRSAKN